MKFFKQLFKPKEAPDPRIEIEGIGSLDWDEESECWVGKYNGFKFSLAYDGLSRPEDALCSLVTKTLTNPEFPHNLLRKIVEIAKSQYGAERHEEIDALEPKDIVFQSQTFILVQFFGPDDNEPFWFAEVHGGERIHVGFDT